MNPYVIMLQSDPDDQYFTQSALAGIQPSLVIEYINGLDEMDHFIAAKAEPALILLNDRGTITEKGQLLRQLKAHPSYNHIPVVVLGEKSSPDYIKECYRAGASTFITKPSSVNATRKKIEIFFSYWLDVAAL